MISLLTEPDMYQTAGLLTPYPANIGIYDIGGITSPNNIPNLAVWYMASDFKNEGDGSEIAIWPDRSGNAYHCPALAATGSRPLVARNSINLSMTSISNTSAKRGMGSSLSTMFLTSKITWTWFGVVYNTSRAAERDWFSLFVTGNVTETRFGIDSSSRFLLTYGNVGNYSSVGMISLNAWHYLVCVNNAGIVTFYLDGGPSLTWITTPSVTGPSNDPTDIRILEGNASNILDGNIAETGIYNRALASTELSFLFTYFQHRYGLA